ncbi:hypothetical protein DBR42_24675 [Pelomonas sp. HMWF004]|nr:hypothetical protein DBR42_24675 [Pelomonas sp. HMWF004]
MPHRTHQRIASANELAFLRDHLAGTPTTALRWRRGAGNALVLWAVSLLGFVIVWSAAAWLAYRIAGIDCGLHSAVAPWLLGIATPLCAVYAVGSSVLWISRCKDYRSSLAADIAAAQVIEEHYVFDAARQFREPEHGGLIYFLRATDGRVLTLDGDPGRSLDDQDDDPLISSCRPMPKLILVRAPQTGGVISRTFSGEPLELSDPIELHAPPEQWPETEAYCGIPWPQLERMLGKPTKR